MDRNEMISKINAFLEDEFEVESGVIAPEKSLKDVLDLDSLDFVDLVVIIEQNFGFKIKGEDFVDIVTFQDFYDYMEEKVGEAAEQ